MPIYTLKCRKCGKVQELIVKRESINFCDTCVLTFDKVGGGVVELKPEMEIVLSTPSAPHWNCRTAHSRSKGF